MGQQGPGRPNQNLVIQWRAIRHAAPVRVEAQPDEAILAEWDELDALLEPRGQQGQGVPGPLQLGGQCRASWF
jgi:hypothetical protein